MAAPVGAAAERAQLAELAALLASQQWLLCSHTSSFFTQRAWERLEASWLPALAALPPSALHAVPSGATQPGMPPGLAAFLRRAAALSLPRQPQPRGAPLAAPPPACACAAALSRALAEGVPAKKRHEVDALAELVARVARDVRADAVLDVGAGQGHLAQALAFRHGVRVLALDAVAPLADAAAARGAKLSALRARCSRCAAAPPPVALAARLEPGAPAAAAAVLDAAMRAALPDCPRPRVVLVGLHACGDLTPLLLRAWARWDAAAAIVVVGCCYNLLTEADGDGGERAAAAAILASTAAAAATRRRAACAGCAPAADVAPTDAVAPDAADAGFPMSAAGAALSLRLGRRARMLACQSADRWRTPAGAPRDAVTARHVFRAALQAVLQRFYVDAGDAEALPLAALAAEPGVHAADGEAFARDAHAVLSAAGLDATRAPLAALAALWRDELAPHAPLLPAFVALRAALAAPLESALLLDRLLYAREALAECGCGGDAYSLPVFDPALSPRNLALVARKAR